MIPFKANIEVQDPGLRLQVKGLSKIYGKKVQALSDVSFDIEAGIFGLLGPNGAGKSTLMNMLATLLLPDQGTITFGTQSVLTNPALVRRQLGFLPQSFGVYPRTTARQLLDYLAMLKGIKPAALRRRHLQELLALTHLSGDQDRPVAQFSGGMKQRFGLAQALLGSPKLLIVDEPTAGLDPYERNHFHQIIGDLAKRMIVILSTHLVADVANLCTNIMILNKGKTVFLGAPNDLISRIQGQVWSMACGSERVAALKKSYPVLSVRFESGKQKVHVLSSQKIEGFQAVVPDLEDAYFAVLEQGGEAC